MCQDHFFQEFTLIRGYNESSLLDLIVTKNPLEVETLQYKSPVSANDDAMITFDYITHDVTFEDSEVNPYYKGDFTKANEIIYGINWEVEFQEKAVRKMWEKFRIVSDQVVEECIPKRIPQAIKKKGLTQNG